MSAEVRGQKYLGVDVDHPKVKEYAKNMLKGGKSVEETAKRIGMPHEVIKSIQRDADRKS